MRYLAQSTDPYQLAIGLDTLAAWVRVDAEAEADTLQRLQRAAMAWAEGEANQPLFQRSYTVRLDSFRSGVLPGAILTGDLAITYRTTAGDVDQSLTGDYYTLLGSDLRFLQTTQGLVSPASVTLTYTAGYAPDYVPEDLRDAIIGYVTWRYDNRGNDVSERYTFGQRLIAPYKLYSV